MEREYVWGDPLLQDFTDYSGFKSEDDFYKWLKKIGITHFLASNEQNWGYEVNGRYTETITRLKDKLLQKYSKSIYNNGNIQIYELK